MNRRNFAGASAFVDLLAVAAITTTATGSAVDLTAYDGNAAILFVADDPGGTSDPAVTFTIEESATGSGSWTAVSGIEVVFDAAGSQKVVIDTDKRKKFIRAIGTVEGTDPEIVCGAYLIALPRSI